MEAADPQHRRLERVEAALGHHRRQLGTHAEEGRRLVRHHQPTGALDGPAHQVDVQRRERTQVDDLDLDPISGNSGGRVEAGTHHRAVADQRDVTPRPGDAAGEQRLGRRRAVELGLLPVPALGLEEDDGVVAADRLLHHPVPVDRVRR